MFKVKKFNSGEWDVKLTERLLDNPVVVHWNWFQEPDIMIPLMKIDAIRRHYGKQIQIHLKANYLPYSRQDRVFEIGQSLPLELILQTLKVANIDKIISMGFHTNYIDPILTNIQINLDILKDKLCIFDIAYPDENAKNHFRFHQDMSTPIATFAKCRTPTGVITHLDFVNEICLQRCKEITLVDDICDGGRTFIECAKLLKKNYSNITNINLLVYHAFMTYGLEDIQKFINHIYIINPDSYEYVVNKFPENKYYFSLGE